MRRAAFTLACLSLCTVFTAAQDSKDKPKMPGKGDEVIVLGCVSGSAFEARQTRRVDESTGLETTITYRLTGSKDLLKQLRSEHGDRVVEISGVLKSVLPDSNLTRGKQIGKSRIYIGGPTSPRPGVGQDAAPYLPVLDVKAARFLPDRCGS